MQLPLGYTGQILNEARKILGNNEPDDLKLRRVWITLAFLQGHGLASVLSNMIGPQVYSGPFKGTKLSQAARVGAYAPVLLGTYEKELHPTFELAIADGYDQVLNIGCSFGYYTAGLALRMPETKIYAFDIDEEARRRCREMVETNNVQGRVVIEGLFSGEDFAKYAGKKTLALVDIEGAEKQLLDPQAYPALKDMDVIVELHDLLDPTISKTLIKRFAPTHDIEFIRNQGKLFDFKPLIGPDRSIDPFDEFLVCWENRDGPTPWGVFRKKNK